MPPTPCESSIFRLLAYMAYASFPLTALEIWRWCDDESVSYHDIARCLETSLWLRSHGVNESYGFWGIGCVDAWRAERIERMTDALRKSRRAMRFARWASIFPWIRMVAICNSLAFSYTNAESDIDCFVVTKPGRLWLTRLVLTGTLAFLRLRPGEASRDPLCLSFFVDDDHTDIAAMKIGTDDPYLAFWTACLVPLFDRDDGLAKMHAVNRWIRLMIPRDPRIMRAKAFCVTPGPTIPDIPWAERWAERVQRARFPRGLRERMNQDTRIVVTDGVLKFHENDRREAMCAVWKKLCTNAGV